MAGLNNPGGNPDDNADDIYGEPTQSADYGEPTQYADYGGSGGRAYSEVPDQTGYREYASDQYYPSDYATGYAPPPIPWYRKPAALVGLGALGVVIFALFVYAIISLSGSSSTTETPTPQTTPTTAGDAPAVAPGEPQTVAPTATQETATETVTGEPTTETVTAEPTTTAPPEVSTSTVTQTETVTESSTRNWPTLFPRNEDSATDGQ